MRLTEFYADPVDPEERQRLDAAAAKWLPRCRAALEAAEPPAPVADVAPRRPAPPMPRRAKDAA